MEPRDFFSTYQDGNAAVERCEPFELESRGHGADWTKVALGALAGLGIAAAGYSILRASSSKQDRRVLRIEDSVQIGRRVEDVFRAWSDFAGLPELLDFVESVRVQGSRSQWVVRMDGRDFRWEARTVQFIPGQAIGWKSVSGPKHTGRITFAPIGDDTLMQVTLNYAPPLGSLSGALAPVAENIGSYLNRGLREFKHAVETRREVTAPTGGKTDTRHAPARAEWKSDPKFQDWVQATGTSGRQPNTPGPVGDAEDTAQKRKGSVEYDRPTKPKYP
jgi:uncharacterized membrane protein